MVTGAASGIGLEISRELAKTGVKVVISDLNEQAAKIAAEELQSQGYEAFPVACDVTKEEQVKKNFAIKNKNLVVLSIWFPLMASLVLQEKQLIAVLNTGNGWRLHNAITRRSTRTCMETINGDRRL
ncbi:SDR family NAD(P)-dependent oxidoreductase [Paenibacillus kribbensis]|uniref:SDR family NAD(P)-dependent oxidoreductase n=1 Tax=Paenibacillus kribbensis TaxID=172713 RepID=UPI003F894743